MKTSSTGRFRGKARRAIQVLGALGIMSAPAAHAAVSCSGYITYLGLSPAGRVTVNVGYGEWFICDLGATYGGFTADACKGVYSGLLAARTAEGQVTFYFNDGTVCANLGTWVQPNPTPYYFRTLP